MFKNCNIDVLILGACIIIGFTLGLGFNEQAYYEKACEYATKK